MEKVNREQVMIESTPKNVCAVLHLDDMAAESQENWGESAQCGYWTRCEAVPRIDADGAVEILEGLCLKMNRADYRGKLTSVSF